MRILVTAATVMSGLLLAMPAWALDDTPTQTPYLANKADDSHGTTVAARQPMARRIEMEELRRPLRASTAPPATMTLATAPAPLAASLPAGRSPALAERAIGLR